MIKSVKLFIFAVTGLSMFSMPTLSAERYSKPKVVYHINYNGGGSDNAYRGALRNIQNHINAVDSDKMKLKWFFTETVFHC